MTSFLMTSFLMTSFLMTSFLMTSFLMTSFLMTSFLMTSFLMTSFLMTSFLMTSFLMTSFLMTSFLMTSFLMTSFLMTSFLMTSFLMTSFLMTSFPTLITQSFISSFHFCRSHDSVCSRGTETSPPNPFLFFLRTFSHNDFRFILDMSMFSVVTQLFITWPTFLGYLPFLLKLQSRASLFQFSFSSVVLKGNEALGIFFFFSKATKYGEEIKIKKNKLKFLYFRSHK